MGELLADAGARRGRHGHGGARVGRAGGRGLRPRQRHPLRPGSGQEPLHRAFLHRARRARAGRRGAAQAEPAGRRHRRQAAGGGRRLHRARHDAALGHPHAARGRRGRGAPAHLLAALALALLLRDRHAVLRGAAGHRPQRRGDGRDPRRGLAGLHQHREPQAGHRRRRRVLRRLLHRPLPDAGPRACRPPSRSAGPSRPATRPTRPRCPGSDRRGPGRRHLRRRRSRHRGRRRRRRAAALHGGRHRRVRRAVPPRHATATSRRCWWRRPTAWARSWPWPVPPAATTPSASTWSPCASTTSCASAPSRCSCSTTSRPARSTPTWSPPSWPACTRAAGRPAAP